MFVEKLFTLKKKVFYRSEIPKLEVWWIKKVEKQNVMKCLNAQEID